MGKEKAEKSSTLSRHLRILELVATHESPLLPTDVGILLSIPKPTAHRLVNTLIEEGMLYTNMRGQLMPAERMHKISLGVLHSSNYKALRRAILEDLAQQIGETCGISIPDGTQMLYYDRVEPEVPLRVHLPAGSNVPIWCTASGKLYLSSLAPARRSKVIEHLHLKPLTTFTKTTLEQLESDFEDIQNKGYSIDNEEFIQGMVAISVPIKTEDGKLVACLFCHAPTVRQSISSLEAHLPLLQKSAKALESLTISKKD